MWPVMNYLLLGAIVVGIAWLRAQGVARRSAPRTIKSK